MNGNELYLRDKNVIADVLKLRFFPVVAQRGKGSTLTDADSKEYLDFSAGWAVANTGYCHPRIIKAANEQMQKLSFSSLTSIMSEESILLGEKICALIDGDFEKKVWFGHSGSDANELLAKMLPLATKRPRIITFVGSYHGMTMGSYSMSGHPAQSTFIGGGNVIKIAYPYCYRCPFAKELETCNFFCLKYVKEFVLGSVVPANQVGAIIAEAVQSDGGDVVPPKGYFKELQRICKDNGIYLIFDEVKVGYGRTGKMFGFNHDEVNPDAVVLGKPMASGQPLSAVVGRKEIMDAATGAHLFTTGGNPVACACGLETLAIIEDEKLIKNAAVIGDFLKNEFLLLAKRYDVIGDVRGRGLIIGIELVLDRKSKKPASDLAAVVSYRCYELGLILFCTGISSNVLEMTPPLVLTKDEAKKAVGIIERSLSDAINNRVDEKKVKEFAGWAI
ncbi:MAG: aspartate aminotransferase family protein [Sphaerochaetaceae bacterium]